MSHPPAFNVEVSVIVLLKVARVVFLVARARDFLRLFRTVLRENESNTVVPIENCPDTIDPITLLPIGPIIFIPT
jgi:hypothetical protein